MRRTRSLADQSIQRHLDVAGQCLAEARDEYMLGSAESPGFLKAVEALWELRGAIIDLAGLVKRVEEAADADR